MQPKNPHIAHIFTQMGRSEELGTGVQNVFKYNQITIAELTQVLSVARETVKRDLTKLKSMDLIEREGSDKTGRWILIK